MFETSRRSFVRTTATLTASSYSRILGANERIRIAVIGCGARGAGQVRTFQNFKECEVVGLCDVYGRKVESAKRFAPDAAAFSDHRKALEMPDLDAVMIATPDHWHVPVSLDAVNAGKDVYCEKPLTLRIDEGAPLIQAVQRTGRVFQTGMQQRSGPHYMEARNEFLRKGRLGKVTMVRTYWYGSVSSFVKPVPLELKTQPGDLDWKRFVGPVKWRPYHPYQYNVFRAYLDYGGGQFTDLFAHWVDVAHMLLEEDRPSRASAIGGFYMPELQNDGSGRTAPDTVAAQVVYPSGWTCTFEATLAAGMNANGVELYGTKGRMLITRAGFEFTPVDPGTPQDNTSARPNREPGTGAPARYVPRQLPFPPPPLTNKDTVIVKAEGNLGDHHTRNFLDCIKSRNTPNADVVAGHRSAAACHLCTLSYEKKVQVTYDSTTERVTY